MIVHITNFDKTSVVIPEVTKISILKDDILQVQSNTFTVNIPIREVKVLAQEKEPQDEPIIFYKGDAVDE